MTKYLQTYAGGITNPLAIIEQITYLMFIRSLDEKELERESFEALSGERQPKIFPQDYLPFTRRQVKRDFCVRIAANPDHWRVKREKLGKKDPTLLAYYNQRFGGAFRDSDLSCSTLLPMIEYDCGTTGANPNQDIVERAQAMRSVEEKLRNPAAHNIAAIKEKQFVQAAGVSSKKLLSWMKWMFRCVYPHYFPYNVDPWDSYNQMNAQIISRLKTGAY